MHGQSGLIPECFQPQNPGVNPIDRDRPCGRWSETTQALEHVHRTCGARGEKDTLFTREKFEVWDGEGFILFLCGDDQIFELDRCQYRFISGSTLA